VPLPQLCPPMTVTRPHEIDIAGELGDEVTHRRRLPPAAGAFLELARKQK